MSMRAYAILSALSLAGFSGNALAQVEWDGDAADLLWFSDNNWSTDQVPGPTDVVFVLNAAGLVSAQYGSAVEVQSGGTLQSGSQIDVGSQSQPSIIDDLQGVVTLALPRGTPAPPAAVAPQINLYGRIVPSAAGYGQMNMTGALSLYDTCEFVVDAESVTSHDLLVVTGTASIGGTLVFNTAPAYGPALGETITVLTATNGVSGEFAHLIAPAISSSLQWSVQQDTGSVWLEVVAFCLADFNGDSEIDFFDVQTFLAAFAAGCS